MLTEKMILKDTQITKFSLYGFFKNLKFFEPYLFIFLMANGQDLFQIGILMAIMETVLYLLEIPSGLIADRYGRKRTLVICFLFYIISFIIFFTGHSFPVYAAAMVFFGMGESFRSGTHKAMIYRYLDIKAWESYKTLVYGRTRSFSLLGTALSSVAAIALALHLPALRAIFLAAIVPYLADIILILSYPDSLDKEEPDAEPPSSFFAFSKTIIKSLALNPPLRKALLNSSLFDSVFKTIKDYIQPITLAYLTLPAAWSGGFDKETGEKIVLGLLYALFALSGAWASRYVHRLVPRFGLSGLADRYILWAGLFFLLTASFLSLDIFYPVLALYLLLNVLKDSRRPLLVETIGNLARKEGRATVLSVESQLKSLFTVLLAPLFGLMAQKASIPVAFLFLSLLMLFLYFFLRTHVNKGGTV